MQIKKLVGKRIKEYRERSGYTQDALAEVLSLQKIIFLMLNEARNFHGLKIWSLS